MQTKIPSIWLESTEANALTNWGTIQVSRSYLDLANSRRFHSSQIEGILVWILIIGLITIDEELK